nr:transmembrane protein 125-like [Nerophis lumbriciformis]
MRSVPFGSGTSSMSEAQAFSSPRQTFHQLPSVYLELLQRRSLEDQVELWWFREPRRSLVCYCASVALILGLGLGGVGFLSARNSDVSAEWRLGVGTALCLLSLAVLLKQLLSSAIQDMNCVHSQRGIELLKSGGRADPPLILLVGLAVMLCGTVLLCVATIGGGDVSVFGLVLIAAGLGMTLAVVGYSVLVFMKRRRERTRRMTRMRAVRRGGTNVRAFSVTGRHMNQIGRETATSRISLI